ncbi:MAG: hypothetical protein KF851_19115 [Pirellulaceae bacterium]|nr:hypothetical protein [Pirellulaceae bacterium]
MTVDACLVKVWDHQKHRFLAPIEEAHVRQVAVRAGQPRPEFKVTDLEQFRIDARLLYSNGPWLYLQDDSAVFDATGPAFDLGYNSTALFGLIQHGVVWSRDLLDSEFLGLQSAAADLFSRRPDLTTVAETNRNGKVRFESQGVEECRRAIKTYIAANVLDQLAVRRESLGARARELLLNLVRDTADNDALRHATSAQLNVLTVDFGGNSADWQQRLFDAGIIAEMNGTVAEFRLAITTTDNDLKTFADRLLSVWRHVPPTPATVSLRDATGQYKFHRELLLTRQAVGAGRIPEESSIREAIRNLLPTSIRESGQLFFVSPENWSNFRESVRQLQTAVYEPARQTAIEKFDLVVSDPEGLGLVVQFDDEVVGIAFAGPVALFPDERGTLQDPFRENRRVMYMLDVTVLPEQRGALGRALKQGLTLLAASRGCEAIHGRNRDRLAGAMWAINLGLGSYELMHLVDDYPDQEEFRDCIYYRCPVAWPSEFDLSESNLDLEYLARLVNL